MDIGQGSIDLNYLNDERKIFNRKNENFSHHTYKTKDCFRYIPKNLWELIFDFLDYKIFYTVIPSICKEFYSIIKQHHTFRTSATINSSRNVD